MANVLYAAAKEAFITGAINLSTATINAVLIDVADYTLNAATHDFLDDVPAAARVGTPQTLGTKTVAGGVFDAADITFPSVTGDPCEALLIYVSTGTDSTSRLIAYIDTVSGPTALSVTPNGGNITIAWDNGASRIFAL